MSVAAVYQADKRVALLCRSMQVAGFRVDTERAACLSAHLDALTLAARAQCAEVLGCEVNPASPLQLRRAFFEELGAPVLAESKKTGDPSLNAEVMQAYARAADGRIAALAKGVLEFRRAAKINSTYLRPDLGRDGRVHPSWHSHGTVSGRMSSHEPNLQNLPRLANDPTASLGGVRSIYVPAEGYILVQFDFSQLEMRIAAYVSGDKAMITACESSDLHAANARLIFGAAEFDGSPPAQQKALRDLAKTSGFAVCYMAEAETVYKRLQAVGQPVKMSQVEGMLQRMRRAFAGYYGWQARELYKIVKGGYVYSPILGRRRYLGRNPSPTEAANFPIQGGAADVMNIRLPGLVDVLGPHVRLLAQVHDAAVFEVPSCDVGMVAREINRYMTEPIEIGGYQVKLPIEVKIGERWS